MQETSNRLAFIAGLSAIFGSIAMCGGLAFKMDQRATDQLIGIAGVVAVIILLCATSIVIALIYSRRPQAVPLPPQIEVYDPSPKQLASPQRMDFLDTGRGQLVDISRVEQMAFQIVHRCKGVEWTYENIKAYTGETNNGLIQQGLDLLAARGQVSMGGQGRKRVRTAPQPAEAQGW